jgi:hypothetical protein
MKMRVTYFGVFSHARARSLTELVMTTTWISNMSFKYARSFVNSSLHAQAVSHVQLRRALCLSTSSLRGATILYLMLVSDETVHAINHSHTHLANIISHNFGA